MLEKVLRWLSAVESRNAKRRKSKADLSKGHEWSSTARDMPGIVQIRDERKDTALIRSAEQWLGKAGDKQRGEPLWKC